MEAFDEVLYEEAHNNLMLDVLFNEEGDIIDNISGAYTLEDKLNELELDDTINEDTFDEDFTKEDELFDEKCFIYRKGVLR